MKNTEIFNDYDMVVSVTQQTINDQLTHLRRLGVIRDEFILIRDTDENDNYVYQVLERSDQIPKNHDGTAKLPYIDAMISPQINITESGTTVTFVLKFTSGTAWFGRRNHYEIKDWTYGINITLDLKALEQNDIGRGVQVPELVKKQLYQFMDSDFTVNHLFMDFESSDLITFNPNETKTGDASDADVEEFSIFMASYIRDLVKKGNPYILGYSLTTSDSTKYQEDQNVPDALRPVGTTYTLYHDPASKELSNLNFVLVTKGGQSGILGTPGNFDTNWISPTEQCDAKMIYSHKRLLEKFILEPFFNQFSEQVYNGIRGSIDVAPGNSYDAAKVATQTGFRYTLSNIAQGNDQYVNWFTVDITNVVARADLDFKGHISLYKEQHEGDATASATGFVDWSGKVSIEVAKDKEGKPILTIAEKFKVDKEDSSTDANWQAKALTWLLGIMDKVADTISEGLDTSFFSDLMHLILNQIKISPEIGNLSVAIGNLGSSISTVVLLPAGQEFFFKNPAADPEANFSLELNYKTETGS